MSNRTSNYLQDHLHTFTCVCLSTSLAITDYQGHNINKEITLSLDTLTFLITGTQIWAVLRRFLRCRLISCFNANLDVSVIARKFIYIFLLRTKSKKFAGQRKGETLQLLWRLPPVAPWTSKFLELSCYEQVSTRCTHIALWLHNTVEWCLVEHFECWEAISMQDQPRSWAMWIRHAVIPSKNYIILCRTRYILW